MSRVLQQGMLASFVLLLVVSTSLLISTSQRGAAVYAVSRTTVKGRARLVRPLNSGDWTTFQGDLGRSGFNSAETAINVNTAANLALQWTAHTHANLSISSQPVEVNGVIYWGGWDGYERASDLTGKQLWETNLGRALNTKCPPPNGGVAGAATVATVLVKGQAKLMLFVGGGTAHFYGLDALTGAILWDTPMGPSPDTMIWGGSAFYNGSIYVGVASYGDCPLLRGRVVKLKAANGTIQGSYHTVHKGCVGGGVWSSPTIDTTTNILYVSTGTDGQCSQPEKLAVGLVALKTSDLAVVSYWNVPLPQRVKDTDFGATPTLFQATINGTLRQMIGLINKNGTYYAFDRTNIQAGPLWQTHISNWARHLGKYSISSSAWDGTYLYVGGVETTINGSSCAGSVQALDPATGLPVWQVCLSGHVMAAVTVVPGVVVVEAWDTLLAFDATTGKQLFSYQDTGTQSLFWGAASISNGVLYIGNRDGNFYAFAPH